MSQDGFPRVEVEAGCVINLVSVSQALLVAEHLSFSRAAQVLGVRQSAVSRRVRALALTIHEVAAGSVFG